MSPNVIAYGLSIPAFTAARESHNDPAVYRSTLEALRLNKRLQEPASLLRNVSDGDLATIVLSQIHGMPFCTEAKMLAFAVELGQLAAEYIRGIAHDLPFEITPNPADMVQKFTAACGLEAARRALAGFDMTVVNLEFRASGMQLAFVFTLNDARVDPSEIGIIDRARLEWACKRANVCSQGQASALASLREGVS